MNFWWICPSLLLLAVLAHGQDAIKRDERLTPAQRQALLGVLRSYIEGNKAG